MRNEVSPDICDEASPARIRSVTSEAHQLMGKVKTSSHGESHKK